MATNLPGEHRSAWMNNQDKSKKWPNFRFNLEEIAGAVGDYGTLVPIVLGVAIVSNVNLGYILLFFSIWYTGEFANQ